MSNQFPRCSGQPITYASVAAILNNWGYTPKGHHDIYGRKRLIWTRGSNDGEAAFVISTPKFSISGNSEPVWPMKLMNSELLRQEVYQKGSPLSGVDISLLGQFSSNKTGQVPLKRALEH